MPDRGDAVRVDLDPSVGHEQGGRRPVIVLSPARANGITDLAVVCPLTSRIKGYPFEIELPLEEIYDGLDLPSGLLLMNLQED